MHGFTQHSATAITFLKFKKIEINDVAVVFSRSPQVEKLIAFLLRPCANLV